MSSLSQGKTRSNSGPTPLLRMEVLKAISPRVYLLQRLKNIPKPYSSQTQLRSFPEQRTAILSSGISPLSWKIIICQNKEEPLKMSISWIRIKKLKEERSNRQQSISWRLKDHSSLLEAPMDPSGSTISSTESSPGSKISISDQSPTSHLPIIISPIMRTGKDITLRMIRKSMRQIRRPSKIDHSYAKIS